MSIQFPDPFLIRRLQRILVVRFSFPAMAALLVWILPAPSLEAQGTGDPAQPAALAHFGSVTVTPAITPSGAQQPFLSRDCDGDGDLDLAIPWSFDPEPVALDFTGLLPGGELPTQVTVEVLTDNAVLRAFDDDGIKQDSAQAVPPFSPQTLVLENAGGIARVTVEGTQLCLVDVCWFQPAETQFIRGDADADGQVGISDVMGILNYVFGGNPVNCLRAGDTNDSQVIDVSDAIFLIDVLFLGGLPNPPFPDCGPGPTPSPILCLNSACPTGPGEETCFGSPELGTSEFAIFLRSGVLEPSAGFDFEGILAGATGEEVHFLIQAETLPLNLDELEALGVSVQSFVGGQAFVAVAATTVVDDLTDPPGVRWAGPLQPVMKLAPELQGGDPLVQVPWAISPNGEVGINAYFHPDVPVDVVQGAAENSGGSVIGHLPEALFCQIVIPPELIRELAAAEELQFLEPVLPPLQGANDNARILANVEPLRSFPYDLTGNGITVAVYDEGNVDSNHPDFDERVIEVEHPLSSSNEHATHVAGIIGGSGVNSPAFGGTPGQFAGMAPSVDLRSFTYSESVGDIVDNPGDLIGDIRHSDPIDVVNMSLTHNIGLNGLNCTQLGIYSATARAVDTIVLGTPAVPPEPPVPFILAVGNERQLGAPCGNLSTVGSPAASKNAIAVGALDPTGMIPTLASSFGPTRDGRTKPDLMAPGCATSTDLDNTYLFLCGTSVSSAVVSGVAALLMEEWRWLKTVDKPDEAPFPPHTIKAVLIHSATDLNLPGPDFRTGWGRVNAQAAVDLIRGDFVAELAGNPLIYQGEVGATMFVFLAEFESDGSTEQKFTLVWDDPVPSSLAARTLVNDLDLRVMDPNGFVHRPWRPDPTHPDLAATPGVDTLNNVEQIVAPAVAGVWEIRVLATHLGSGASQSFTVVRQPSDEIAACQQRIRKTIELTPAWTGTGDRDYDGHGPIFDVSSFLEVRDDNEVWITLDVEANEDEGDFTGAQSAHEHLVFYDPDVATVNIVSNSFDVFNFTSSGHDPTTIFFGGGGLMRSLFFVGDANDNGPEAGFLTRVRMTTNPIRLQCNLAAITSLKRVIEVDPVFFLPPQIGGGDNDFDGNGPGISLEVTLAIGGASDNELIATVTMDALEVGADGTHAFGTQPFVVHTHPVPIASILSDTVSTAGYIDIDHHDDRPNIESGNLVREFKVVGDTDGPDAGVRTSVTVDFNPIRFLEQ